MGARLLSLAALALAGPSPPAWLQLDDGVSRPQFALGDAIEETAYVPTELDTDGDGRRDRIRLRISRPRETETQGIDVPVVLELSPYRGRLGEARNHDVDVRRLGPASSLDGALDDRYVPRGYAVVLGESLGTAGSDGCPDVGGPGETAAAKAVVEWLGSRPWSSGAVGMVGTSYDGTLAKQAATTGVAGLKAIIPIAAISSWYDYYRANGLVVAPHSNPGGTGTNAYLGEDADVIARFIARPGCERQIRALAARQDRATGDANRFWSARDFLPRAPSVTAATFLVHGLDDWNVRTKAFSAWWERLAAPRKLWLHAGGHTTPTGAAYRRAELRWLDRWLHGVPNGIDAEPAVTIHRDGGGFAQEGAWPAPGTTLTLQLSAASRTRPGALETARSGRQRAQSFVDRGRELDTDARLITSPAEPHPNRLVYRTAPLPAPVRLSGTPTVRLRLSIDNRRAANLTAVLVDYGPHGPAMVTRGWRGARGPGRRSDLTWDLQPDDHVFGAGHRIGLVVVSTDHDYTLRPRPGTRLTLDPAKSEVRLPVASSMTTDAGG